MNCPECDFTNKLSLEERQAECLKIQAKYPNAIPTIIVRGRGANFPALESSKFLIPRDLTVGHFIYVLRTKIKLLPEQAIFVFINGVLPPNSQLISQVYEKNKSQDGFLYLTITSENTFGN
jgi:GABA(A) receptor-associated protein